jgi:hypothetical protein
MIKNTKKIKKIPKILKFQESKSAKNYIFPFEFSDSKNCNFSFWYFFI